MKMVNLDESFKFPSLDRNIHIGVYAVGASDKAKVIGKCILNPKECKEEIKTFNLILENCPDKNATLQLTANLSKDESLSSIKAIATSREHLDTTEDKMLREAEIHSSRENMRSMKAPDKDAQKPNVRSNLKANFIKALPENCINRKASWYKYS